MIERNLFKPFGPSIAKVTMSNDLVDKLNDYIDGIIKDENKAKELNHGNKLAGNVSQEFKLEEDFIKKSGWLKFLSEETRLWIKASSDQEITKFNLIDTWVVRQFEKDYNPLHFHSGHISGVGYLKVPKSFGEYSQKGKSGNQNGKLSLVHGTKQFLSSAIFTVTPKVGDFYFFPNYLLHEVYPFFSSNEERRSISFNANIDEKIYNVYGS